MITNITNSIGAIGVLMMVVGAVGSIIYYLFTPFISTLNDELRPIFGTKMEAFAAVRCAACHKLGYVMPVDSKPSKCLNCGYEF